MKIYDTSKLEEICRGDQLFVKEMIKTFIKQIEGEFPALENEVNNKNWDAVHRITHKLKPSIEILSIKDISEPLQNIIENTRNKENLEHINEDFKFIKSTIEKVLEQMKLEL